MKFFTKLLGWSLLLLLFLITLVLFLEYVRPRGTYPKSVEIHYLENIDEEPSPLRPQWI